MLLCLRQPRATMMRSAALLCVASLVPTVAGSALDTDSIKTAVALWLSVLPAAGLVARTAVGVVSAHEGRRLGTAMDDSTIRTAVDAWFADATAAEAAYGHISTWDTSGVTDMRDLFRDKESFNEDIGAWDTSGVTTMERMSVTLWTAQSPMSWLKAEAS